MDPRPDSTAPLRAEYAARFNRVVDHVQAHLDEPLDLATLAEVACFSPCHFHRLFHGWMGETVHDFIFRLRVERAASQLLYNPGKSITEIALDCGFSSPSVFARAFRSFHGTSASGFRQDRKIRKALRKDCEAEGRAWSPSLEVARTMGPSLETTMNLHVDVQQLPPMPMAYLRHVGPYQGDAALFEGLFGRICAWAGPRGLLGPGARFMSLYRDHPGITDPGKLRLEVGLIVPGDTKAGGEVSLQTVEGGAYAVARVRIHPEDYMATWDALMGGWLPGSGYQPDDRPCIEFTLNNPKTDPEGMHDVEICLAVRPL